MERLKTCIYNIPICGGFCAPTVNPEPGALRHFSNEYTVPASRLYMNVGPVVEWSGCCRFFAGLGCAWGDKNRKPVMLTAFVVSLISWFLILYSVIGLSTSYGAIVAAPWAKGTAQRSGMTSPPLEVFVGLKARAEKVVCSRTLNATHCNLVMKASGFFESKGDSVWGRSVEWGKGSSCEGIGGPLSQMMGSSQSQAAQQQVAAFCEECRASATASVSLAVVGLLSQTVQMATDLQRSTPFGDVNCQATMGVVTGVFGLLNTAMSLRSFANSCWRAFPSVLTGTDARFEWSLGPALVCMVVATLLKVVDIVCHFVVPTPAARRNKPEKDVRELADYMMTAVPAPAKDAGGEAA